MLDRKDRIHTIKHLRDQTGCGLSAAKKSLEENNWSFEGALDTVRANGQDLLMRYSTRETKQGIIKSYVHPGDQLAVIVEVRCETDFSAKTSEMNVFAEELAMHIAALHPLYTSRNNIPEDKKTQMFDRFEKHANVLPHLDTDEKIDHHLRERKARWYGEVCLLDQRWVHDESKTVADVISELTNKIREKIEVARWTRWQLGVDDNPVYM